MGKRLIVSMMVIIAAGIIMGCMEEETEDSNLSTRSGFKLGEKVRVGTLDQMLEVIVKNWTVDKGDKFPELKKNEVFVRVAVSVENVGQEDYIADLVSMTRLVDEDGNRYLPEVLYLSELVDKKGQGWILIPGRVITGEIVFKFEEKAVESMAFWIFDDDLGWRLVFNL